MRRPWPRAGRSGSATDSRGPPPICRCGPGSRRYSRSCLRQLGVLAFADFEHRVAGRSGLGAAPEAEVHLAVAVHVVFAQRGEVAAEEAVESVRRGNQLGALLPAEHIPLAQAFAGKFDGAFAAYFEDHAFVRSGIDVGVVAGHQRIGIVVGGRHVEGRHAHAVADDVHGQGDVFRGQRTQLGLGLGVGDAGFPDNGIPASR